MGCGIAAMKYHFGVQVLCVQLNSLLHGAFLPLDDLFTCHTDLLKEVCGAPGLRKPRCCA